MSRLERRVAEGKSFFSEYLQAAASQSHPVNALVIAVITWYLPIRKYLIQ